MSDLSEEDRTPSSASRGRHHLLALINELQYRHRQDRVGEFSLSVEPVAMQPVVEETCGSSRLRGRPLDHDRRHSMPQPWRSRPTGSDSRQILVNLMSNASRQPRRRSHRHHLPGTDPNQSASRWPTPAGNPGPDLDRIFDPSTARRRREPRSRAPASACPWPGPRRAMEGASPRPASPAKDDLARHPAAAADMSRPRMTTGLCPVPRIDGPRRTDLDVLYIETTPRTSKSSPVLTSRRPLHLTPQPPRARAQEIPTSTPRPAPPLHHS